MGVILMKKRESEIHHRNMLDDINFSYETVLILRVEKLLMLSTEMHLDLAQETDDIWSENTL